MATGVGDIFLDLKLNKQPFEKGLNETKASASLAGRKIGLAIGGAIAGAVGAVGFSALVSSTAKLGDAIDKTSQKMGMSAQAYQEWDFIMQRCGTSMESMTMAMKTLASSAVTSKDALAELGISQEEVASLSQEQLFARTIQALQNVEDTTRRTYLAGQLLGRGATELGAVLNMSASETDALRQRVYELGGVMSQQAVTASAQYTDAMLDLKMAFRGVSDTVAVTVLPIITSAINKVIIPVILRAVAVVRYFGNIFASMFGGLGKNIKTAFGAKAQKQNIGFGKSMGGISKGIGGAGKSAKKAKKAVKELNRELMGFDKINKLSKKQKADGGGGAGGAGGAGGVGDMGLEPMGLDSTNKKLGIFGKLGEKLRPIWKALGDVFKAVIRLFKAIGKALAPVGKWIWEHLIKPFGKLLGMAIVGVLEGIAGAFNIVALFVEKHPRLAVMILAVATALFAFKRLGGIMGILLGVNKGMMKLVKAFSFFTKGNVIILALTAIALAIGYIYQNWDKIKKTKFGKALIKVGNALKTVGKLIWKSIVVRFKLMVAVVKIAWAVLKKIGSFLSSKFKKAVEVASKPVQALKDAWAGIKDKTVELKGKIGEGIENLGEAIGDKTAEITLGLKDNFSGAWDKVKDTWDGVKNKTAELLTSLKDTFKSAWDKISGTWNSITGKTAEFIATMKDTFSGIWNGIKSKWSEAKTALVDKTASLVAKMTDTFSSVWNGAKTKWNEAKTALADKTATLTAKMADAFSSVWSGIKSKWDEAKTNLTNKTATLKAQLENAFSGGLSAFKTKWNNAKDDVKGKTATLKATLDDNFSSGLSKFKEKWKKAKDAIKGKTAEIKMKFTDSLKKGWNALAKKVNSARGKSALAKKLLPAMPTLAQGGWVDKNTPQLAVVGDNRHEPEIVAPDSKLMAMARQASQEAVKNSSNAQVVSLLSQLLIAVQNQNTNIYLDGKAISNNTVKHINQDTRRTGKLAIIV